jgi:hypothetical protein
VPSNSTLIPFHQGVSAVKFNPDTISPRGENFRHTLPELGRRSPEGVASKVGETLCTAYVTSLMAAQEAKEAKGSMPVLLKTATPGTRRYQSLAGKARGVASKVGETLRTACVTRGSMPELLT